jgi:menaquinone reductase, multiheme cytochrome c subunit
LGGKDKQAMRHTGAILFALGFSTALAAGWAGFPRLLYRTEAQPLQFSHKTHAGEKAGLACDDCHSITEAGHFTGIPKLEKCSTCHAEPLGKTLDEKKLVEQYVKPVREIDWLVYSRQPQNVRFPHAIHLKRAKLDCVKCHGEHGKTETLRVYEQNRISGYSRDIWGQSISRMSFRQSERPSMKMDDCLHCHDDRGVITSCRSCHK